MNRMQEEADLGEGENEQRKKKTENGEGKVISYSLVSINYFHTLWKSDNCCCFHQFWANLYVFGLTECYQIIQTPSLSCYKSAFTCCFSVTIFTLALKLKLKYTCRDLAIKAWFSCSH